MLTQSICGVLSLLGVILIRFHDKEKPSIQGKVEGEGDSRGKGKKLSLNLAVISHVSLESQGTSGRGATESPLCVLPRDGT